VIHAVKFLVVAAFEPELVRFRELVRDKSAPPLVIEAIGVGVVDAAIGMTRCIARQAPTHAVLLGTCGAFEGRSLAIGDVVSGRTAQLACESVAELPPQLAAREELDVDLHDALVAAGAKSVQITNSVGITVRDVAPPDADVEHLESFAFARACAAHSVRAAIALGVANRVGSSGLAEWRQHHVEASLRAAEIAWAAIRTTTTTR